MLNHLQQELAKVYEVEAFCNVDDYLITEKKIASALQTLPVAGNVQEQLLVSQSEDQLDIALFIDQSILSRLQKNNPETFIHNNNLNTYWLAVEGVSHFLYLTWRAKHNRPVTQLELELQAEVDKFVRTTQLLEKQNKLIDIENLHELLFEQTTLRNGLSHIETERYQTANRYAAKYCLILLAKIQQTGFNSSIINDLRRFYRLSQSDKIRHICTLH